jgi:hypothetical protein
MVRAYAALAALLIWDATSFAQVGGAPNHSNGNTTRTQTIQPGEPNTTHPGGNPGRTTGRTSNQSPFGGNAASGTQPANPSACATGSSAPQGSRLSLNATQAPTQILAYPVTYNGGNAVVGSLTIAQDADLNGILCLLVTISNTNNGGALINGIESEAQSRNLTVEIVKPDPSAMGPSTRPGGGGDLDWLKAQPASLSVVYANQPSRPKDANKLPDFSADGTVQPPIWKSIVFGAGLAGIRGKGVGSTIRFSPSMFPLNTPGIIQTSNAGADVGLVHELIHALRHLTGVANRTPVFKGSSTTIADAKWLTVDEREVIGDSTVPANWVTENGYRQDKRIAPRNCVAPSCF